MNQPAQDAIAVIVKWLKRSCEIFSRDFSHEMFRTYCDCLYDLRAPELELGFSEALRRTKFFPTPAEVRMALDVALERMPRRREADENCNLCGGTGWKLLERDGQKWAATCDCRPRRSA